MGCLWTVNQSVESGKLRTHKTMPVCSIDFLFKVHCSIGILPVGQLTFQSIGIQSKFGNYQSQRFTQKILKPERQLFTKKEASANHPILRQNWNKFQYECTHCGIGQLILQNFFLLTYKIVFCPWIFGRLCKRQLKIIGTLNSWSTFSSLPKFRPLTGALVKLQHFWPKTATKVLTKVITLFEVKVSGTL